MTRIAASIMVQSLDQALSQAAVAAEQGADLVEYRIDQFADLNNLGAVTQLVERSPLPCIITCRPTWEGGHYDGDDQSRIAVFEHACLGARQPAYMDVELAAWQRSANLRQKIKLVVDHPGRPDGARHVTTGLILSTHDFTTRPTDLYQRVEAMASEPACRVIKFAWMARSLRDNVEALELIGQHKPTIALCMGDAGTPSRILARKFGALLTFAALDGHSGTAPGQPTISELKKLYRWDRLSAKTRVFGVIGHPVGHSLSPHIHNAGFDAAGYDGVYLKLPIPPEYEHFKATMITWLECAALHFRGASVTIPHKENLLRFVRERGGEIEPLSERIGAANTLHVRDDGSLYACNTDYAAALDAVCDGLKIARQGLAGRRVAVLGAGGAARAIVAGFAGHGATVVIYNRTVEKAQKLADEFASLPGKVVAARLEKLCDSCCEVYINCTPIGMHPNVDQTPMVSPPPAGSVVFDTIYNPVETRLLREAREAGCVTIPGLEMFVRQGAAQFELWTGKSAPLDVFRDVIARRLKS